MKRSDLRFCVGGMILVLVGVLSMLSAFIYPVYQSMLDYISLRDIFRYPWEYYLSAAVTHIKWEVPTSILLNDLPLILIGFVLMLKGRGKVASIVIGIIAILLIANMIVDVCYILGSIPTKYYLKLIPPRIRNVIRFDPHMLYHCLGNYSLKFPVQYRFGNLLRFLPVTAMFLLALADAIPAMKILKKVWFFPGVLFAAYFLIGEAGYLYHWFKYDLAGYNDLDLLNLLCANLLYVAATVGFLLSGKWLANPEKKPKSVYQPQYRPAVQPNQYIYRQSVQPQYQPQGYRPVQQGYPQQPYQQPYQGGYPQQPQYQAQQPNPAALQELERYQQMLQAGVITQEEYNAARARILGL